jgi:Fe-S oxidoreductase
MVEKIQRGNFTSAYRVYRNQVLFPGIVCKICSQPCYSVCVRQDHDQPLFIRKLEAACVAYTKDSVPIQYNVPVKKATIAVIGSGLSGLSCALKLAARNYRVRLYEAKEHFGGRLWKIIPPEAFLSEFELQFSNVEYEYYMSSPIQNLDDLDADAIYIATGHNGEHFGLLESVNTSSLGTSRQGVFMGGALLGVYSIASIEHGVRASHSIEKYLKVGAMDGMPETYSRPTINNTFYKLPVQKMLSSSQNVENLSKEEAIDESLRCMRCTCSECRDHCEMMQHFNTFPMKLTTDIMSSLNVIERLTERVAQRLVNSCTQCGVCKEVCPEGVDMETCILETRRALHRDMALPKAFHDFWLRDMEHADEEGRLMYCPPGNAKCRFLFFPGCQLGASDPEYVFKTYSYLCERHSDTGLLLACCGVPANWAGDEERHDRAMQSLHVDWERSGKPKFILSCPTCYKTFSRYFPESEQVSLYEHLAQYGLELAELPPSSRVTIYDPCSSREFPSMQQSVRTLVERAGFHIEELDTSHPQARCCSFGGNIYAANQKLAGDIVSRRLKSSDAEYITYCSNCRDIFSAAGKECRHILDVLFALNHATRRPPSLSQRRANRLTTKAHYLKQAGLDSPSPPRDGWNMQVIINPDLLQKMDKLLILEEDVKETLKHCENSNQKVLDQVSGQYSGHLQIGIITYWVTYSKSDDGYILHNVYSHRMSING